MPTNPTYAMGAPLRVRPSDVALPGMFNTKVMTREAINLAGERSQVLTLKLTAATPSVDYSVTVNGFTVTFKTPATITMANLQLLLLEKLAIAPEVSGLFDIAASGADSVTLTAINSGLGYAVSGTSLITVTQSVAPMSARALACGTIVTGRSEYVSDLQVCGAPSAVTEKPLGATQYSHGLVHDIGEGFETAFDRGDTLSLVSVGQGWLEFESMADPSVNGSLFYRAVPNAGNPRTGRLVYAASAPAGFVEINASLDSETTSIADGRIVGLVTLSLI